MGEADLASIEIVLGGDGVEVGDLGTEPSQQSRSIITGDGGDGAPSLADLEDAVQVGGGSDELWGGVDGREVRVLQVLQGVEKAIRNMFSLKGKTTHLELVDCWGVGGFVSPESFMEGSWILREGRIQECIPRDGCLPCLSSAEQPEGSSGSRLGS